MCFNDAILTWFDTHGRKNLPWQKQNAYAIWVSEIMLQQTQVKTVIPYFERFLQHFPDIDSLANAPEEAVLTLWAGLGYYARARNLHKTAKLIQQQFQSQFPKDLVTLQTLPGIGRSTAGAILSMAFGERAPILDGNVRRVLTRFHGITTWPGETKTLQTLWDMADRYTPTVRVGDYTQAMMDLGAVVCRKTPDCTICPLKMDCIAYQTQTIALSPGKKPKKPLLERTTAMLVLQAGSQVLLKKRPPVGVWGGALEFSGMRFTGKYGGLDSTAILLPG